jgi:hypothetical protein
MDADKFRKLAEARVEEMKKDESLTREDLRNDEALGAIVGSRIKTIERQTGLLELCIAVAGLALLAALYFLLLKIFPNTRFILIPIGALLLLFALFFSSIKKIFTGKPDGD